MTRNEALRKAEAALAAANKMAGTTSAVPQWYEAYTDRARSYASIARGYLDLARELKS